MDSNDRGEPGGRIETGFKAGGQGRPPAGGGVSETVNESVLRLIEAERERQRARWGDSHDDVHGTGAWLAILSERVGKFGIAWLSDEQAHERLVEVAAVAIAALEAHERGAWL